MRHLKIGALIALFLAAIVAANLTLTHFGVSWLYINAFFLIGLDFITRDRLADFWGTTRWAKMALLIAAGGALSYWLNADAAKIAIASTVSFAAAEGAEATFYHLFRKQPWLERAPKAAIVAAAVDSIVFPTMVFGFVFTTSFTQFAVKLGGAAFWAIIVARFVTPPNMAPAVAEAD
jgi:queuosine precursor transporter